jgi:trigger factor
VEKNVRHRLLIGKIVEAEKIETTEEEIDQEIEKQAGLANMSVDQAKDYFKKNNMTHALEHEIKDRKAVDILLAGVKEKKGKKTAYQDLIGGNL